MISTSESMTGIQIHHPAAPRSTLSLGSRVNAPATAVLQLLRPHAPAESAMHDHKRPESTQTEEWRHARAHSGTVWLAAINAAAKSAPTGTRLAWHAAGASAAGVAMWGAAWPVGSMAHRPTMTSPAQQHRILPSAASAVCNALGSLHAARCAQKRTQACQLLGAAA